MTKRKRIPLPGTGGQFTLKGGELTQTQKPTEPRKPGPKTPVKPPVKPAQETGK
jgi:hypothetical protein